MSATSGPGPSLRQRSRRLSSGRATQRRRRGIRAFDSSVVLRTSSLTSKGAGAGGIGGAKGIGATGGSGRAGGSAGANDGCPGGDGGKGGDGGSGGGGAGGVSAAIVHKGTAPTNDGSTLTPGIKGGKGIGATAGTNDGPDGQQVQTLQIQ